MSVSLEICCTSLKSAIIAQKAGASRIELCDNILEGGTTPSAGLIARVKEVLDLPLRRYDQHVDRSWSYFLS